MRISIKYEASWRNSFLDGSNNEPLSKTGRRFIGSMTELKKRDSEGQYPNYIKREVTLDTVMGILNRLIGDQRKLYQSRKGASYFFSEIESQISFQDRQDQDRPINNEVVYVRNITGSTDQNSFTGMISADDLAFSSEYSGALWGVLMLSLDHLCRLIVDSTYSVACTEKFDPLGVLQKLEELNGLKPVNVETVQNALVSVQKQFPDVAYKITGDKIKPIELYCSALYMQLTRLSEKHDISKILTTSGGLAGISRRGFTPKDFMARYTTGSKKPIWGNPYQLKERRKGEGEVVSLLTKANGTLDIHLDISDEKAEQLKSMIDAAAVSSFYLGKKGLAYVDVIR